MIYDNYHQEVEDYTDKVRVFNQDLESLFETLKYLEKDYKELKVMEEKLKS